MGTPAGTSGTCRDDARFIIPFFGISNFGHLRLSLSFRVFACDPGSGSNRRIGLVTGLAGLRSDGQSGIWIMVWVMGNSFRAPFPRLWYNVCIPTMQVFCTFSTFFLRTRVGGQTVNRCRINCIVINLMLIIQIIYFVVGAGILGVIGGS